MKSSESIKNLSASLVKAQSKIENLYPSSKGYSYDYVPLNKIIDMLKKILPEFGLSYIQLPFGGASGQTVGLTTRIIHESGEWLEETAEFPVTDMKGVNATQKAGAAITYFRRYALLSAFGVTGDKDVDAHNNAFDDNENPEEKESFIFKTDTPEVKEMKNSLIDWINNETLQGSYAKKAEFYMTSNDIEGMRKTIEWCKSQTA